MDTARGNGEKNVKKYFIFYIKNGALKSISRKSFKAIVGCTFFKVYNNYIKVCGNCDRKPVQALLQSFFAEGLMDKLSNCVEGVRLVMDFLAMLGTTSKFIKNASIGKMGKCVSLLLRLVTIIRSESWSVSDIVSLLIDIYFLVVDGYVAQSLDAILLAGASLFLPPQLADIIRRVQLFSSVKICDDYTLFYKFMKLILEFMDYLVTLLPSLALIVNSFKQLVDCLSLSPKHFYLYEMEKLINKSKNPKSFMDKEYRDALFAFECKIQEDGSLIEWSRRSAKVKDILDKWKRVVRIAHNQASVVRKEPTAYILEGPPGCRKSVVMNRLIEALNEPCYSHLVKSSMDGKDWYDCYNNETIFFMDDVGQQGASQWRTLINMVSPVRLPLDCAAAELKDTKFFNSEKIFITTNNFINLGGICKQDCISDVRALWRRGVVFDFSQVTPRGDALTGVVVIKHYDTITEQWRSGPHTFVSDVIHKLKDVPVQFEVSGKSINDLVQWMMLLVKGYDLFKESIKDGSVIDSVEAQILRDAVSDFYAEGDEYVDAIAVDNGINSRLVATLSVAEMDEIIRRMENDWLSDNYNNVANGNVNDHIMYEVAREAQSSFPMNYISGFLKWIMSFFGDIWKSYIDSFLINVVTNAMALYSKYVSGAVSSDVVEILTSVVMAVCFYACLMGVVLAGELVYNSIKSACKTGYSLLAGGKNRLWRAEMCKFAVENVHNSVKKISEHSYRVVVETDGTRMETHAIISGRTVILPAHSVIGEGQKFLSIRARGKDSFLLEHEVVLQAYLNNEEDVCVLKLPSKFPTPFKKISNWFKFEDGDFDFCSYLVSEDLITPLSSISGRHAGSSHKYYIGNWSGEFKHGDVMYNLHGDGMCGSVLFSTQQGIRGFHVAGNESKGAGVSKLWKKETIRYIRDLCDLDYHLPQFVLKESNTGESVIRIEPVLQTSTNVSTEFGPSPLFGIFPVTRAPADLTRYGRSTVKVVASKSFSPTKYISAKELEFGKEVLRRLIKPFKDITMSEVVKGNSFLAPLNKDSSNGLGCKKGKSEYIDFENGCYTPLLVKDLGGIRSQFAEGIYPVDSFLWSECLKDELRNEEKDGVPRSFRISTVHNQVLCKEKFGNMVAQLMQDRYYNGIMVGVNPFKEWDYIYGVLKTCKGVFAADTKLWDGGMLPQVQRAVVEVLLEKYEGEERELCELLLESLVHTILMIMDEGYITTHSFPSGHYLTAIMNSLVNRFYSACWYYREMSEHKRSFNVSSFLVDVVDYVYGDDKLNGIRKHEDILNALTMKKFFNSIGLDLTNADKSPIVRPFSAFDDLDFLKRKFVYHLKLGRIMCPLSLRTLQSGLSYVNLSKDVDQVMFDKIHNYVREIYLHPNYAELRSDFEHRLRDRGVFCNLPSEDYLYDLYSREEMEYETLYL